MSTRAATPTRLFKKGGTYREIFNMAAKEATASALRVVVFLGTVRENNYGSRAGKFIVKKLTERGFHVDYIGKQ